MKNQSLNVFILNDDVMVAGKLRRYLKKRFGDKLNISLFFNSRSCLRMLNGQVDLVVVDDYLQESTHSGIAGLDMLQKVKERDPHTEVIILSSDEDVATAVEAMKLGARSYIRNDRSAWQHILTVIDQNIQQPIRYLIAEFGVNVFMVVFFAVFATMGIITYLALRYWVD
jgi:DNA-binding NtrC family response regulator